MMNSNESNVIMTVYTWLKDAHGLFDYESDELSTMCYTDIGKGGKVYRNNNTNETTFIKDNTDQGFFLTGEAKSCDDPLALAFLYSQGNQMFLAKKQAQDIVYNKETIFSLQEKVWSIIGQTELKGIRKAYATKMKYIAKKNDIIRFGRVEFIIKHLFIKPLKEKKNNEEVEGLAEEINSLFIAHDNDILDIDEKTEIKCKLCKGEEREENNPVIKPCKCPKSPFLHVNCFKDLYIKKDWVTVNTIKGLTILLVDNFICDKCDEPYQSFVIKHNNEYSLLPYTIPETGSYIIMESINFVKESIYVTMVLIFNFTNESDGYYLGRGHEATFKVSDISISRVHSKIYLKSHQVIIEDLGSKFGTFVLCRDDLNISNYMKYKGKVQIGRTVISFEEIKSKTSSEITNGKIDKGTKVDKEDKNDKEDNKIFSSKKKTISNKK